MFHKVEVTLDPAIADRAMTENHAVEIRVPAKKFVDVPETILSYFDVLDVEPNLIGTIQLPLPPMGSSGLRHICHPNSVRVSVTRGGRKRELLKLMNVLRQHTLESVNDPVPDKIPDDAGDAAIGEYWRRVLLKWAAEHIVEVHTYAARGFVIFEVKDGASAEFEEKVFHLGNPF